MNGSASRARGRRIALAVALAWSLDAAAADAVLAELPFLEAIPWLGSLGEGYIAIDLSPDPKRPFPMLLDTGASVSLMTPRYARQLRVTVRKHRTYENRRATVLGRDLLFRIDTRSSETASRSGLEVGLLGGDFLRSYVVEVDYGRRWVRFLDPELFGSVEERLEEGELLLPMGLTDGRPTLQIALGRGSARFVVDTGAPVDLAISEERAEALAIAVPEGAPVTRGANLYGTDRWAHVRLRQVALGGYLLRDVGLGIAMRSGSEYRATNLAGPDEALLGSAFLRRFRVRFDYPSGWLALLPVPQDDSPEPAELARARTPSAPAPEPATPAAEPTSSPRAAVAAAPERERAADVWPDLRPDLEPVRPHPVIRQQMWLELGAPDDDARLAGRIGWLEVRGWAGAGDPVQHDVVLLVDTSGSTAYASGVDVDGDGKLGRRSRSLDRWRSFNARKLSSDPDDSVLAAELVALRRLVELLDPERTRIGIVSFSGNARLEAPVGSEVGRVGETLERLDGMFGWGGTNLTHALALATAALEAARAEVLGDRRQSILILSDGYPTTPQSAFEGAVAAAADGVRIYTFALGEGELGADDVYVAIADVSGGSHARVQKPGEIIHELPRLNLANVAGIEIANASSGERGRAVRVFADGTFDGFVPLVPGRNEIRITARGDRGGLLEERRTVHFERREPRDAAEARRFEEREAAMRAALRARTVETELAVELGAARGPDRERARSLEVEVEEDRGTP